MPSFSVFGLLVLLLAFFALLALFAVAFTLWRALTLDFLATLRPDRAFEGRVVFPPTTCHRRLPHPPRKRWRRTPGMQSGLPPPTALPGRAGPSACFDA